MAPHRALQATPPPIRTKTGRRLRPDGTGAPRQSAPPPERVVTVALGDRAYDIRIRPGLLADLGQALLALGAAGRVAIVTNSVVNRLYGVTARKALREAGFDPITVVLPEGERAKTLDSVAAVLDRLAASRFERRSVVVALGGGVIGDIAGFAAAVYVRGVPVVQVPTTLVAQVDSSVGGKTGVNHPRGKNLIGAFHQPRLVLIDPQTLRSLPAREWVAGLAEVIKYGVIADEPFFTELERTMEGILRRDAQPVQAIIARSCEIKAAVVAGDERENDRRRILNYGHTIGHALESLGRYRRLIHGEAVAIGMVQEAELALSLGRCTRDTVLRLRALLETAGLPTALPRLTFRELWAAMQHDKKVVGGQVYCVLPDRIGQVTVSPVREADARTWFDARPRPRAVR